MSAKKWIIKDENISTEDIVALMAELGIGYLLALVLLSRGVKTKEEAKKFLNKEAEWHDPMLLPDIALALNRIKRAKTNGEKVAVYGDYDADGITATAIMVKALTIFGIEPITYIPDRIKEGYGLNINAIDYLKSEKVNLIITVDCGIASKEEIRYAKSLGIDVVVTDHHNCPADLPNAVALINPKREKSLYPFSNLAGAGVAYKFATALLGYEIPDELKELAAIGTVGDVMDLVGENRTIVREGLSIINKNASPGVRALLDVASKTGDISSTDISFILSPRINCAGRMETPDIAYKLLTAKTYEEAYNIATYLNELNRKRQKEEAKIYEEAVEIIKAKELYKDNVVIVGSKGWNHGVIGIVASKITEALNKPCLLVSYDEGEGTGSARSIEGFDLYEAMKDSSDLFTKFGGHELAAGFSLMEHNEKALRERMNDYAKGIMTEEMAIKKTNIDAVVPSAEITNDNIRELSLLEPTGAGNAKPMFALVNAKVIDAKTLSEGKHLKLFVEKDGKGIDAIAFGFGSVSKKIYKGMTLHLAGMLEVNDFTNRPQMIVRDILY